MNQAFQFEHFSLKQHMDQTESHWAIEGALYTVEEGWLVFEV